MTPSTDHANRPTHGHAALGPEVDGHQAEEAHSHGGGGQGHDHGHHSHHDPAQFRDRFWVTLVATVPVVFFSEMFQELLGYTAPRFPGSTLISPLLGIAIFVYGGWPFLTGAVQEARARQPGMMLL
ncbi:MAG: heavy metal translocating P-type ATPase, partial [Actinomycetota bacterium]|nr:heavy metal translocating P-type ATPase [Actinomycetota bacterium]